MKEEVQEITEAVNLLTAMSAAFERGQTITWEAIEAITGPRDDGRARYIIGKWRRALWRDREIVTLSAPAVGIRLLTHKETAIEIPRIRQRKAYRQIRRAYKETSLVDDTELSLTERRLLAAQRDNMAAQRRALFRSRRELEKGAPVTEVNPRRTLVG